MSEKITEREAYARTQALRVQAIAAIVGEYTPGENPTPYAVRIVEAYRGVEIIGPSDCGYETPYGPCERDYGHPATVSTLRRVEGPGGTVYEGHEIADPEGGGHYTYEPQDTNRPDGSHPWDF